MCGIVGILNHSNADLETVIRQMTRSLNHRGPDSSGVWMEPSLGVALGHTRLSILDLSQEGHQPMVSRSGRFVITYNGEVYNFGSLRKELEPKGHLFRGTSDTEVMLAAFEEWGVEAAVQKFIGMFAFALWDRSERTLHLVRDRLGIKPLYFGWAGKTFLFGSELKALRQHPTFSAEIDRDALALYLRFGYFPTPFSIYRGFYKLTQGSIFSLPLSDVLNNGFSPNPEDTQARLKPKRYWDARQVALQAISKPFQGSDNEAAGRLEDLLKDAIELRMIADVPLGAFLSGGIDSSTVVALMQSLSSRPVKTFTIGFQEDDYNEALHAKRVANHLGTDHTELYLSAREAMDVIPMLPGHYDEPFSDSSQIPTFLVSQLARRSVTVSLSGDGGDELFGGYTRHHTAQRLTRMLAILPRPLRKLTASGLRLFRPDQWTQIYNATSPFLPESLKVSQPGNKIPKLIEIMDQTTPWGIYQTLVSHWKDPASIVKGAKEPETPLLQQDGLLQHWDFTHWIMYLDALSYLPDDLLTKVDRASMAVSLEARVPLIDHRVVEFAWRLPLEMKIRNGEGKRLLRRILCQYVPKELIERPKMGFSVPLDHWLRGDLREWAEDLLEERRLRSDGFFEPQVIREKWAQHLSGRFNWQHHLWDILMCQAWLLHESHN